MFTFVVVVVVLYDVWFFNTKLNGWQIGKWIKWIIDILPSCCEPFRYYDIIIIIINVLMLRIPLSHCFTHRMAILDGVDGDDCFFFQSVSHN